MRIDVLLVRTTLVTVRRVKHKHEVSSRRVLSKGYVQPKPRKEIPDYWMGSDGASLLSGNGGRHAKDGPTQTNSRLD
jgi:hypothetical protein